MANYIKKKDKKVETRRLISNLKVNSTGDRSYWSLYNLTPEELNEINSELNDYIKGFESGELSFDENGVIHDSTGKRESIGNPTSARLRVASYINNIFDKSTAYIDPNDKNKIKYDASKGVSLALNRRLFGGQDKFNKDFLLQDDEVIDGKRKHSKRAKQISDALSYINSNLNNIYLDLSDLDRTTISNNIQALLPLLADGELSDSDRMYMSNLGINPDIYLSNKIGWDDELETPEEKKKETEVEKAQREIAEREQAKFDNLIINANKLQPIWNSYVALNPTFRMNLSSAKDALKFYRGLGENGNPVATKTIINDYLGKNSKIMQRFLNLLNSNDIQRIVNNHLLLDTSYDSSPFLGATYTIGDKSLFKGMTNKDVLSLLLGVISNNDNSWNAPLNNLNHYIIGNGTLKGTVLAFDPINRSIYESKITDLTDPNLIRTISPEIADYVNYQIVTQVPSLENGGKITKALFGATIIFNGKTSEEKKKEREEAEKARIKNEASKTGKTKELIQRGESTDFSAAEYVRMAGITADLVSAVSSLAPGAGTAVSAASSIAGIGSHLTADIMDKSVSTGEVFTNLLTNTALSAFALIPGGGYGKIIKSAKALLKFVPKLIGIASAAKISFDPEVHKSLKKLEDPSKLTVNDLKNIGYFVSSVSALTKAGADAFKTIKYKQLNKLVQTNNVNVKSLENNHYIISKDLVAEINKIGLKEGYDAANKAFLATTKSSDNLNAEFKTGLFKGTRSKLLEGETIFKLDSDMALLNRALAIKDARRRNQNPKLYKYLRSNYEIYANEKLPFRFSFIPEIQFRFSRSLNLHLQKVLQRLQKLLNQKYQNLLNNLPSVVNPLPNNPLINPLTQGLVFPYRVAPQIPLRYKKGGQLQDTINLINSFKTGGKVLKFDIGGWFNKLYTYKALKGWNNKLNQSAANPTITTSGKHYKAGDLNEVWNVNLAYTGNKDIITFDLNNYYNNEGKNLTPKLFVKLYNNNAGLIRGHWDTERVYGSKDAGAHNALFRKMFASRSGDGRNAWDIGYDEKNQDIEGSSTWLRRMDRYENEFDTLSDELKKLRIHKIGNFYVTKSANGDILLLDNSEAERILNSQPNPIQEDPIDEKPGTDTENDAQFDPKLQNPVDTSPYRMLDMANHLSKLGRVLYGDLTNRRVRDLGILAYSNVPLQIPKHWQSPIMGDYGALINSNVESANIERMGRDIQSADPSLRAAAWLLAHDLASRYRLQGKMLDDARFRQTSQESKARSERSMESRVDTANTNTQLIDAAKKAIAQTNAEFYNRNYGLWSNYAIEQEQERAAKQKDFLAYATNLQELLAGTNYQSRIQLYKDAWDLEYSRLLEENPNISTADLVNNPKYQALEQIINEANLYKALESSNFYTDLMGLPSHKYNFGWKPIIS